MQSTIVHTTDTATVREQERRRRHHRQTVLVMAWAADNARFIGRTAPTYGLCLTCGALEVRLDAVTGHRDYSSIGEPSRYPTGHGCELCS
jgi:hypothetical protein